jgi:hypothetical protein
MTRPQGQERDVQVWVKMIAQAQTLISSEEVAQEVVCVVCGRAFQHESMWQGLPA